MSRKQISKRTRFEVFKRDNFTCQYCSAKPPKVPLEVDHIIPVSKKGTNEMINLITACFDCNRGKSNIELADAPASIIDTMERKRIAQQQYLDYKKVLKKDKNILESDINEVESVYSNSFNRYEFTERFRLTVGKFIKEIGFVEVEDAMIVACNKIYYHEDKALKYFCGICWNKIKGN
jgi:hypothetical protein